MQFQFTHPGKGATSNEIVTQKQRQRFNSRTLGRVRLALSRNGNYLRKFQFTHPGKGATGLETEVLKFRMVSIHAPWEGCDGVIAEPTFIPPCFNSRTLGRVRLDQTLSCLAWRLMFQFTHPGKGATTTNRQRTMTREVSIHAPWEGCDRNTTFSSILTSKFQFTHPGKGATPPKQS